MRLKPERADRCELRDHGNVSDRGSERHGADALVPREGRRQCSGRKPVCRLKPESAVSRQKDGAGAKIKENYVKDETRDQSMLKASLRNTTALSTRGDANRLSVIGAAKEPPPES